jgi:hypothetical protein
MFFRKVLGLALAAIKGLNEIVKEQTSEFKAKTAKITALERDVTQLKDPVNALLEKRSGAGQ